MSTSASTTSWRASVASLDGFALLYTALPVVLFLQGWIVAPLGWLGALLVAGLVLWTLCSTPAAAGTTASPPLGRLWWLVFIVATAWCVVGGLGHLVYANSDWVVRDAVVVDLVRDPWPVRYHVDGSDLLLRSAIGYYLPAALVGKLTNVRIADLALLVWTIIGVAITLALILRDRPSWRVAVIRIAVFVLFSGMDIVPTVVRGYPHQAGAMIEWWSRFMCFPSQSTSLFWAPNHTISVWIATAWLASQPIRSVSIPRASLFVVLIPLSSPLADLGLAALVFGVIVLRFVKARSVATVREVLDGRVLATAAVCIALIFPYLLSGSGEINSGFFWDMRWVGDDFVPRYIEIVLVEFLCVAIVLLVVKPRDPLLWFATLVLLALPVYRFGPYDDLAMRGSIAGLAILAIRLGQWMGTWVERPHGRDARWGLRIAALALFALGTVTPFMELVRPFLHPAWPIDPDRSIVEASQGAPHYLTSDRGAWLERFLEPSPASLRAQAPR
jgi:hypothetical protein